MTPSANGHDPQSRDSHGSAPHEVDPGMQDTSRETFSGFVRLSTYGAIGIALLLIAMALFLL